MTIVILNSVFIFLLGLYIVRNPINDNKGNEREYGWREYSVFFGLIILFNSYTFITNDWGYIPAIIGFFILLIGFYSGAFDY